ncbi:bacteriocin biosynthesis cyclodehydratase, SagC family [Candidatus Nitrosopumilus salaria BD31]|uniref:Bacteriocin biosynthesis cyclodehydratase, SagC family n=1 Tax=Candidatus Nitrosopumilus salarius BD31 TaxID=859350 RepID=I3D1N5_9ARCH|nr:ThiF family adenylyltransferase [Candidatus Nitrosopumilus salaria]EIJ65628.1 bacteriocin biosynthesis cyclodehydratase, SagC family [Candidatus Nitrosopumilus salaria BD31]
MANIVFTIPSVLNQSGGEKKTEISADSLQDAFVKISNMMGDDFKRRVLEGDGTPRSLINIYINGKNAKFSSGMDTILKDGDEVYILPAVAGGSEELSTKELDRFSRQVMLEEIGYQGQLKLKNSKVCVVGTGGLGNPITSRLAAMGVGTLRIVDRDVIELSNLHRQTMFDEDDVGQVKVEVAAKKLQKLNPDCKIESLAISVNDYTALEVVEGCDVVIDALDSVNARYALNKACVKFGIPFVTGAAVGVSGQAFTILPKESACYYCMFPELDEDTMPTCSIEGVHPSILSIVGGIEVAEAVKIIIGKKPSLSERILHIDLENLDFNSTRTFRAEECPICGTGKLDVIPRKELILEELCGRNRGKRTYSITPTETFDVDVNAVTSIAKQKGFIIENQGDLGLSMRTNELSVSFMKKGSAVIVGPKDEPEAIELYKSLLGKEIKA